MLNFQRKKTYVIKIDITASYQCAKDRANNSNQLNCMYARNLITKTGTK